MDRGDGADASGHRGIAGVSRGDGRQFRASRNLRRNVGAPLLANRVRPCHPLGRDPTTGVAVILPANMPSLTLDPTLPAWSAALVIYDSLPPEGKARMILSSLDTFDDVLRAARAAGVPPPRHASGNRLRRSGHV